MPIPSSIYTSSASASSSSSPMVRRRPSSSNKLVRTPASQVISADNEIGCSSTGTPRKRSAILLAAVKSGAIGHTTPRDAWQVSSRRSYSMSLMTFRTA